MRIFFKFFIVALILTSFTGIVFCSEEKKEGKKDYSEGKKLFESKCNQCHGLDRPLSKVKNLEEWKATTSRMAKKTLGEITNDEAVKIAEYLADKNLAEVKKKDEKEVKK